MTIELKKKPVECCFSYFYNDKCSLVVDIIRHHERTFSRIFYHEEIKPSNQPSQQAVRGNNVKLLNFSKYCALLPDNDVSPYFVAQAGDDYLAIANVENKNKTFQEEKVGPCTYIAKLKKEVEASKEGKKLTSVQSLNFTISYTDPTNDPERCFSVVASYDSFVKGLSELNHRPSLLNRLVHISKPNEATLRRLLPLFQEDFPLVTVKKVVLNGKELEYDKFKGAIAHHWGDSFPEYIFLMCNKFTENSIDSQETLLTLSFCRVQTALAVELITGYVCFWRLGERLEFSINNLSNMIHYFSGKDGSTDADYLIIKAWRVQKPQDPEIRVRIVYKKDKVCSVIFSTGKCYTYFDVDVYVKYEGKEWEGKKAILDVKGFELK